MKKLGKFAAYVLVLSCGLAGRVGATDYQLSFKGLNVAQGERVIGFDIAIKPAYFSAIKNAPLGWHVEIDNQPSWNSKASGSISVGAAALDVDVLCNLLHITTDKDLGALQITGEIVTTSDFKNEHHIALKPSDVHLTLLPKKEESKGGESKSIGGSGS